MIKRANAGRLAARPATLIAMLAMILTLAPAVSAAPPSACEPFPGDTTIRWNSLRSDVASVEIQWFDANGSVIQSVTVQAGKGRPFHRQPTPQGTEEFGASFFDESGNAIGVTGGVCGAT